MSVFIKGMKIPRNCWECEFNKSTLDRMDFCTLTDKQYNWGIAERPSDCPLVEVPTPHGDLIDRDELRASFAESVKECNKWANEVPQDTMMYARISQAEGTFVECSLRAKAMPTIIEAEVEE